jgi:predicted transcriptional regulator
MRLVKVESDTIRPPQIEANLADDAVAVLHQVDQEVEHLGFHGNSLGTAAQLPPVGIKPVIGKEKFHVAVLAAGMRNRPQGIIKLISWANQGPGKVFRPGRWHPSESQTP